MKIGQARVSTKKRTLETRLSRLAGAGCEMFFEEKSSGAKGGRPRLEAMLDDQLRKDGVVAVTKLDCRDAVSGRAAPHFRSPAGEGRGNAVA